MDPSKHTIAELPDIDAPESNTSHSGSGASSPQYGTVGAAPSQLLRSKPIDLDFAAEDSDMWDMLLALDADPDLPGAGAPAPSSYARACISPEAFMEGLPPPTPLKPLAKAARAKPGAGRQPSKLAASSLSSSAAAAAAAGGGAAKPNGKAAPAAAPMVVTTLGAVAAANVTSPGQPASERPGSERHSSSGSEHGENDGSFGGRGGAVLTIVKVEGSEDGDGDEMSEDKRLKRMRRNRESAAMSRNRKKLYVEELETQVASLHEQMRSLQEQNFELRRACARARGSSLEDPPPPPPPPPLPATESAAASGGMSLAASTAVRLPTLPMLDALSREGEDLPVPLKRSGSPLMGAMPKRASAASLALMSAVTFVTLSVCQPDGAGGAHGGAGLVPSGSHHGQRALMSLNDYATQALPKSLTELLGRKPAHDLTVVDRAVDEAVSRLWPSLALEGGAASASRDLPPAGALARYGGAAPPQYEYEHFAAAAYAAQLPPPEVALEAMGASLPGMGPAGGAPTPRGYGERVIRAPQNSSWADVLRIEAAEKQLAEAQLTLRSLGRYPPPSGYPPPSALVAPAAPTAPETPKVEEQVSPYVPDTTTTTALAAPRAAPLRYERGTLPDAYDSVPHFETANDSADDEYDTQRYIFCSRAYMFDAAVRRPPRAETPANTLGVVSGAELDLPPTMPARFRGIDFNTRAGPSASLPRVTDGNTSADDATSKPVVTLLLPSAALQGMRLGDDDHEARPPGSSPKSSAERNELMQVQCQVLNASRVVAPTM